MFSIMLNKFDGDIIQVCLFDRMVNEKSEDIWEDMLDVSIDISDISNPQIIDDLLVYMRIDQFIAGEFEDTSDCLQQNLIDYHERITRLVNYVKLHLPTLLSLKEIYKSTVTITFGPVNQFGDGLN